MRSAHRVHFFARCVADCHRYASGAMERCLWRYRGFVQGPLIYPIYRINCVSARTDYLLILDQRTKLISSSTFNLDLVASNGIHIPLILPARQFLQTVPACSCLHSPLFRDRRGLRRPRCDVHRDSRRGRRLATRLARNTTTSPLTTPACLLEGQV